MPSYSQYFRDIVINKYEEGMTEFELSKFFNIDKRTVVSWIEFYKRTGDYSSKQGVGCGRVASFTDKTLIEQYLIDHPDASALDIKEALAPNIPRSTFYDCLNRLGFSFKKKTPKYKQRKEHERLEYIEKLKEIAQNLLFYIDEMGCDNKLSILRGWSLIGEPSYGEVLAYQTQRRSIVAGYNYADKKIIAPLEYSGYTNTEIFNQWFEEHLCPSLKPKTTIVMDNASFHKSSKLIEIANKFDVQILYLPPYSPDLNPIEKVWANFKKIFRKVNNSFEKFCDAISYVFNKILSD
ncbi:IS630 family transposase [Francisella tularensis]|uniref:IS630 family transposase n=1 Tax=Francisella tularensis TaxID=263 RepID=UPI0000F59059|nr:IS630 family transposase [Francisella tularensis]ABO46058.1 transposase ISFtu1 [Francisella tularensis subsp. tularensis WY96-3418]ABO46159.1 transposase ISFtu1 [Francisella tularensis subsp. tularensis WY96-3418]ABO46267.1 transposase ISFtu1 [Francisella tularensis subsp. tularensis WY96-3418]ABO46569.1 transposase ISFtu1 [Francisella tularensis subsp. tularensis WY96-3418]ABO46571.1 transposase ISFtu1 [Francisella tularensis subsp. tularensis WY96-3418]